MIGNWFVLTAVIISIPVMFFYWQKDLIKKNIRYVIERYWPPIVVVCFSEIFILKSNEIKPDLTWLELLVLLWPVLFMMIFIIMDCIFARYKSMSCIVYGIAFTALLIPIPVDEKTLFPALGTWIYLISVMPDKEMEFGIRSVITIFMMTALPTSFSLYCCSVRKRYLRFRYFLMIQ